MCDGEYYEGVCTCCDEIKQIIDNEIICESMCDDCFNLNYDRCSWCGDKFCLISSLDENGWCEGCVSRNGKCEDCGEYFSNEDLDEHGFCEDCRPSEITEEEKEMIKILKADKELCIKVARKIVKMIIEPEKKQKKYKLKIVGVYQQ